MLTAGVFHEAVGEAGTWIGEEGRRLGGCPYGRVDGGKPGVGVGDFGLYFGDKQACGQRKRLTVDGATANDEWLGAVGTEDMLENGFGGNVGRFTVHEGLAVITMLRLKGSAPLGSASKVRRPMITGWPEVRALKRRKSSEM